ncbi:hypothetical protein RvY_05398 [Ramazzottius varieornatus]|uniref:Uncharacterized protein n=1 Tax=Ramazzottius varieornatus TaxID=947166 RepID=A0A1D1UVH9_RAMVA|nr:hypothetical protein RvY_05398 [Ramazzottius varieornatus]
MGSGLPYRARVQGVLNAEQLPTADSTGFVRLGTAGSCWWKKEQDSKRGFLKGLTFQRGGLDRIFL